MIDIIVNLDEQVVSQLILSENNAFIVEMLVTDFSPIVQNTVKYGA